MIWIVALYSARLWLVLALVNGQLTQQQKDEILDLHNEYRSVVKPEATNMMRMKWNQTLTKVAEKYSTKCIWKHNPEISNIFGENLYITSGKLQVSAAMLGWFQEHESYNYDSRTCKADMMCGHYTQMVWAKSTNIGCASHLCETVQGFARNKATILVCNYYPPGNWKGASPYVQGKSCSKCPENLLCIDNACGLPGSAEFPKQSVVTLLLLLLLTGLMTL